MKYLSYLSMAALVLVSNFIITNQAHATIYKCVKSSGEVFYNDKPCPSRYAETTLKHEKEPKNPYVPETFVVLSDIEQVKIKTSSATAAEKKQTLVSNDKQQNLEINPEENEQGLLATESDLIELDVSKEKQAEIARLLKREEKRQID